MLDVTLVSRALQSPGHDVPETAIEETLRLVQAVEHKAAAERAARELKAGSTDIRLIAAFLLGAFDERGPAAIPGIVGALTGALSEGWEALKPTARRDRVVDSALSLLFRGVKASLDFHEKMRDAIWRAWAERVTADLSEACAAAISALDAAIAQRIPQARCAVELAGLRSRAQLILQKMPPPPAPPAPPEPEPAPAPVAEASSTADGGAPSRDEPDEVEEVEPRGSASPSADAAAEGGDGVPGPRLIEVSPALEQFIRKIEVFSLLVERGEMGKAAIVAQDIRGAVEHFDPRVYLPRLLTPHFRLLSAHIQDIAAHWEKTGSPAWQALEQLYQVDLDAFLEP